MNGKRGLGLGICLWLCSLPAWAQDDCEVGEPTRRQTFTGNISRADFETYRELPFTVPAGTRSLHVRFDYDREQRTTIDLGLLDPDGFRGWSGGNKQEFLLTDTTATPSYRAGPLTPGEWRILLGVPNIREQVEATYSVIVTLECGSQPDHRESPVNRGPDWYRGDLHSHNGHSDGYCDSASGQRVPCPPFVTLQAAAQRGLDFVALTDHNSVSQYQQYEELRAYFDTLLLLPGREVTTFFGHANVFGSSVFIDFRLQPRAGQGWDFLLAQVQEQGALLSINHPGLPSGEDCMGCGWILPDTDYGEVAAVEVVNGGSISGPYASRHIGFWQDRLNAGHRLTGIGGSDNHDARRSADVAAAIGHPTTWVFAEQLSVPGILAGIRSGNVFIDVAGSGVRLTRFGVNGLSMGESLAAGSGGLDLQLAWESAEILHPRWIHQGEELTPETVDTEDGLWRGHVAPESLVLPGWLRVDLVNDAGDIRLVGNPVYLTGP
ncbi:MAG: hypothetical protein RLZZ385_1934 [Pseudomonadota bacterium]